MADEPCQPPPIFDDEDDETENHMSASDLMSSTTTNSSDKMIRSEDREEDIFAEANEELSLDSPSDEIKPVAAKGPSDPLSARQVTPAQTLNSFVPFGTTSAVQPAAAAAAAAVLSQKMQSALEISKDEDQYSIEISVKDPKKMGDGMTAYMAYKVITKTNIPDFRQSEAEVYRRFSDFLGLHEKLVEKHLHQGRIIPPPPEKSVIGMTKIKMKEDASSAEFVEQRRAALERFVNAIAKHPCLQTDPNFVDFLELEGDLPRSTSTSALSGTSVMKLFSRVGDSFGKISYKVDETDQWFDDKQKHIEALDVHLRKLHASFESLVFNRKDLAQSTGMFANSVSMLGAVEEHTSLSRALSQLAAVEEKVDLLHVNQSESDFYIFSELIKDYVGFVQAIKEVFHERVKLYKMWRDDEALLVKKREALVRLEQAHKTDKIAAAGQEITECEQRVEKSHEEFDNISKSIKKELDRFEKQRYKDMHTAIILYLQSLMNNQQQLIKYWESFLPEAKAIA